MALWVSGLVTVTETVPAAWAGVTAVIEVELLTVTEGEATAPKSTVAPLTKPVPVRVTAVPPAMGPDVGATDDRVGAGGPPPGVMVKLAFEMSKKMLPTQATRTRAWVVGALGMVTASVPSLAVDAARRSGRCCRRRSRERSRRWRSSPARRWCWPRSRSPSASCRRPRSPPCWAR